MKLVDDPKLLETDSFSMLVGKYRASPAGLNIADRVFLPGADEILKTNDTQLGAQFGSQVMNITKTRGELGHHCHRPSLTISTNGIGGGCRWLFGGGGKKQFRKGGRDEIIDT